MPKNIKIYVTEMVAQEKFLCYNESVNKIKLKVEEKTYGKISSKRKSNLH